MTFKTTNCALMLILSLLGFQTASAQLKLLSPDGGEFFTSGNIVPILWTGVSDTMPVRISYSPDGGTIWKEIASGVRGNRYLWQVPITNPSSACLVRVETLESSRLEPEYVRSFQAFSNQVGVNSVAISPDGQLLATAGSNGTLILWNIKTGEKIATMPGHSEPIILTRFSPDGSKIATGSIDATAILWDVNTHQKIHTLQGKGGRIWPVGFNSNGTVLATGNDNGSVTLWDVETGAAVKTFTVHDEAVRYLEYSQDGTMIMTSSTDRTAKLVNAETGEVLQNFPHHTTGGAGARVIVNGIQFATDESVVITCGYDGYVKFWNSGNGKLITTKTYHNGKEVSELQLSHNGRWLASVGYDGTTKLVNPGTGEILADISPNMQGMIRSSFSEDDQFLAISHFDGKATLWKLQNSEVDVSDNAWILDVCDDRSSDVRIEEEPTTGRMDLE